MLSRTAGFAHPFKLSHEKPMEFSIFHSKFNSLLKREELEMKWRKGKVIKVCVLISKQNWFIPSAAFVIIWIWTLKSIRQVSWQVCFTYVTYHMNFFAIVKSWQKQVWCSRMCGWCVCKCNFCRRQNEVGKHDGMAPL